MWRLPYERVLFLDADHTPILAGQLEQRRRRFEAAWLLPLSDPVQRIAGMGDGTGGNVETECVSGGLLLLRPNATDAQVLDAYAREAAEYERLVHGTPEASSSGGGSSGRKMKELRRAFARCPGGHDMLPLNRHFKSFARIPLHIFAPNGHVEPAGARPWSQCAEHNTTSEEASAMYASGDTFHSWNSQKVSPLHARTEFACKGHSCSTPSRLAQCIAEASKAGPPADAGGAQQARIRVGKPAQARGAFYASCAAVFAEYVRDWWRAFSTLPRETREACLARVLAPSPGDASSRRVFSCKSIG